MGTYFTYHCPNCGTSYSGAGEYGKDYRCQCGCVISSDSVDFIREDAASFTASIWCGLLTLGILHLLVKPIHFLRMKRAVRLAKEKSKSNGLEWDGYVLTSDVNLDAFWTIVFFVSAIGFFFIAYRVTSRFMLKNELYDQSDGSDGIGCSVWLVLIDLGLFWWLWIRMDDLQLFGHF